MPSAHERVVAELVRQLQDNVEGLEGLEVSALDLSKTFPELGASSLDMVEVVSTMMSRLKVPVDRTAFARLKNLGEMVDLFTSELEKQS